MASSQIREPPQVLVAVWNAPELRRQNNSLTILAAPGNPEADPVLAVSPTNHEVVAFIVTHCPFIDIDLPASQFDSFFCAVPSGPHGSC
jgi:hypothetical protein